MAISKLFIFALLAAMAHCEPPVRGYNYQPPSTNYGAPSSHYNAPSNSYGAPNYHASAPSTGYGAPNTGYGAPSGGNSAPSSHYNAPSNSYRAPNYHASASSTGYGAPSSGYGAPSSGHGGSYDNHDHGHDSGHDNEVPKSYEFGYSVKDAQSGNDYGRKEVSDGNTVRGEYRVQLPDGRMQIVTYHADWQTGFHADVRYEGEATYPEQTRGTAGSYLPPSAQGSYNAPSDYSGSLTGFHGNHPTTAYGPPGYHG